MKFNLRWHELIIVLIISSLIAIAIHTKDIWFNYLLEKMILNEDTISETINDAENKRIKNKITIETVFDYSPKLQNIMDNIYIICKKGYKFAVYIDDNGSHLIQLQDTDENGRIIIEPCKEMNFKFEKD